MDTDPGFEKARTRFFVGSDPDPSIKLVHHYYSEKSGKTILTLTYLDTISSNRSRVRIHFGSDPDPNFSQDPDPINLNPDPQPWYDPFRVLKSFMLLDGISFHAMISMKKGSNFFLFQFS